MTVPMDIRDAVSMADRVQRLELEVAQLSKALAALGATHSFAIGGLRVTERQQEQRVSDLMRRVTALETTDNERDWCDEQ